MNNYLRHPYFDCSGQQEWHEFPLTVDGEPAATNSSHPAEAIILRDFEVLTRTVLERLKSSIPVEKQLERPYPYLTQLLFHSCQKDAIKIFLEFRFMESLTENTPYSDRWWAIVICPHPNGCPYTGRIDYYINHFGWAVDWMSRDR